MAEDKKTEAKDDPFALTVPSGLPAYPQVIYKDDGKWPDGSPKRTPIGTAKNPEEHKKLLEDNKGWDKK